MRLRSMVAAVAALCGAAVAAPAAADPVAEFYDGKTVTIQVPSSLGASLGLYGRLVVDHIGRFIPGTPNVIIESRPGAGGTVGAAFAYNVAPKDGTYIAEVLAPSVLVPLLREDARFDGSKFQWIGSIAVRPAVISVWNETTQVRTLEDAKRTEVLVGSTGKGSETYMIPALFNALYGTKFKVIIGYKGGAEVNQAMETGEVQGRMNYWGGWTASKPDWLRDNKLTHLVQYGPRIPELSDVPTMRSLFTDERRLAMVSFMETAQNVGMGFWVPPGVPEERITALRRALDTMVKDPAFLADAEKRRAPIEPVSGEELQRLVEQAYATPRPIVDELRRILGFIGS